MIKSYQNLKTFNITGKKLQFQTNILSIPCAIDLETEQVYGLHKKAPNCNPKRDYLPSVIIQLARENYLVFHERELSAKQTRKVLMNRTTSIKDLFYKY